MWLIARGRKHALSGQMERKIGLICKAREVGPKATKHATQTSGFPFLPVLSSLKVSSIPRLVLSLVMTWLKPSQDKCSHRAPVGRERHSPHTEQTQFSGPLPGCRTALSQFLENCGECPDGLQAGARREVSLPPTTRAAYVDTQ